MKFVIKNINKSIDAIMRQIGYTPAHFQNDSEFSTVRKLTRNDYPRFHLYIREKNEELSEVGPPTGGPTSTKTYIFSLHLDQKKPSYPARIGYAKGVAGGEGSHMHSGEYDGELVENETRRIKQLLDFIS